MKKLLLLFTIIIWNIVIFAAPFSYLPYTITQPNGEVINCFVSGDEFFNWIHDQDGYTIIQGADGYYYYAKKEGEKIIASSHKLNKVKPESVGIPRWVKISNVDYQKRKLRYELPSEYKSTDPIHAPHTGTLNNIVVYIRFSDDTEITTTRKIYDDKLNPETGSSLKAYYKEVSYNQLTISSTHYPAYDNSSTSNFSYQDSHPRGYFKKYNAATNPAGYQNDTESRTREHQLLADAIEWINANYPVSNSLNIDADNDGRVDNVCFMIKGNSEGWSDLLWAHRWVLYSKNVYINDKRVYDYTFQPENQVSVTTLCHEMFHALGAPDLYHYNENSFSAVGSWDLMHSGSGHMGAYMKWKYAGAKWITSIPEITSSGTYSLSPLLSSTNNCFKIASPNSTKEFFVVEYRRNVIGTFENNVPGSGMLVYRINTDFEGNAGFDNSSVFDEVYIYRPGGTVSTNGTISNAYFSSNIGRTAINATTNPSCFLTNGLPGGLDIFNITSSSETISFDVYISSINPVENFVASSASTSQINLSWTSNVSNEEIILVYSTTENIGAPIRGNTYSVGAQLPGGGTVLYAGNADSFNHTGLAGGTNYFYKIWSKSASNEYSPSKSVMGSTQCETLQLPFVQGFNGPQISPCWVIQVVAVGETEDEPASISQVQAGTYPTANPNEGSHMIQFNSAANGTGNKIRLYSPEFSTVGETELFACFDWHRDTQWPEYLDKMTIQWSTDGINWNNGDTYNRYHTSTGWTQQTYSLPSGALNQQNLRIGFLFISEYGYNCYLDKFRVRRTVATPSNFSAQALSASQVALGWTLNNSGETVVIAYSSNNSFGFPVNGTNYSTGAIITGGGKIIYTGTALSFNQTSSLTGTNHYYKIWSKSSLGDYSEGVSTYASTALSSVEDLSACGLQIYPNPSKGLFKLANSGTFNRVQIEIYELSGNKVYSKSHGIDDNEIDLTGRAKGICFIKVKADDKYFSQKLIIE